MLEAGYARNMGRSASAQGRPATVLLVEDDASVRGAMARALARLGLRVMEADSCATATRLLSSSPDVVVTDLRLPDGDAFQLLPRARALRLRPPVFIVTGHGSIDLAVRAVKEGAEDFMTKPVDVDALGDFVMRALERRPGVGLRESGLRERVPGRRVFEPRSDAMKRVEEQVEKLRDADCTVLLLGETGTGKSFLARRIHAVGARARAPFVDINCAGLAKDFVESELFGHERGAFTGALNAKPGLLDQADGGTLFLDEIGDVDIQVQPKLLKVLEEKRFRRMGDVRERSVDVRLVCATHHDLIAASAAKRFRADLYYRISCVTISMPPLRERRDDVVPLAHHVLDALGFRGTLELANDAKEALLDHAWPGNLRELRNVLERAVVLRSGDVIRRCDIRFDGTDLPRSEDSGVHPAVTDTADESPPSVGRRAISAPDLSVDAAAAVRTLSEVEREHIVAALTAAAGRVEVAAKQLGIPRSTLYQRIKTHGIVPADLRKGPDSSSGGRDL